MSTGNEIGGNLRIARTRIPSLVFARLAQPIGYEAWHAKAAQGEIKRTDAEIRHMFDPDNTYGNAERLYQRMHEKVGMFVGVVALLEDEPIGYTWAADDVGAGTSAAQYAKRLAYAAKGKKPYAWVAQINVLPDCQNQGVGSVMLEEVLAPFDFYQKPTAYVFDENKRSLAWFKARGFGARPDAPEQKIGYFGNDAAPVMQWRLEALCVGTVQCSITAHCPPELPYYELLEARSPKG